jgi:4-amino-4-deoxy-L-arabinose transferase-like glycosyltransferase
MLAVLALATGLRAYHLTWGLPEHHFPDEATLVRPALQVAASGDLHTGFVTYPPLTTYLLAAVYAADATVRRVSVTSLPWPDLVVWGRVVMAACSIATVAAVGTLGRALGGPTLGLIAALFTAVLPLHVTQSHIVCTDVPLTLVVTLTLVAAVRAFDAPLGATWTLAGGGLAGLAAATKYPGGLVLLAPLWTLLVRFRQAGTRPQGARAALLVVLLGLTALAAFTLGFPHWVVDLASIRARLAHEAWVHRVLGNPLGRLAPDGVRGTPIAYQLLILFPAALGVPLYLLALVGLVLALRQRDPRVATLFAFGVPYFFYFATARTVFPRYYLPLVPVLVVAAAQAATAAPRRLRVATTAITAAYGFALCWSLTAHTTMRPQAELRELIARELAAMRVPAPRLARNSPWFDYAGYSGILRDLPVTVVALVLTRDWLEAERPDLVVVSQLDEIVARRDDPASAAARALDALATGSLPYRLAGEVRVSYLNANFYAWLDPYFGAAHERGEMGFRLYARTRAGP